MAGKTIDELSDEIIKMMTGAGLNYDQMLEVLEMAKTKVNAKSKQLNLFTAHGRR